jgi:16S rRNA (guanine527-N7)-methyltransferase
MAFGARDFQRATNVSRETLDKLQLYADLLVKWQKSINLVSKSTIDNLWRRHFMDSAQIAPLIENSRYSQPTCADLGAGGGFPGMVLAAMEVGEWTLIESDTRKCVFLNEVVRQCEISATIRHDRVERVHDLRTDIVTARAFAPLDQLLAYSEPILKDGGTAIFPKGQRHQTEIIAAKAGWSFDLKEQGSETDEDGKILIIQKVKRV